MPDERAIDKAVKAFHDQPMQSLVVPELGDLEIFFTPMTIGDMKWAEMRKPKTEYDHNLYLIIRKAKDAGGTPLFQVGDKQKLDTEVSMAGLIRVIQALTGGIPKTDEEAKEAIATDPT